MHEPHLDAALAEEFADHAQTVQRLQQTDPRFAALARRNHELWQAIQKLQKGLKLNEQEELERLEKQRLALLDELAARIAAAEAQADRSGGQG